MVRARRKRTLAIDHGTWRCIGVSPAREEAFGYGRRFESSGVFFSAGEPFQHEKPIGSDTQTCMMMKATPIAPFVVPEADLLLEFPVIAFDAPAHFDDGDQFLERDAGGQCGQEIAGRPGLAFRPFDEQPFLVTRTGASRQYLCQGQHANRLMRVVAQHTRARPAVLGSRIFAGTICSTPRQAGLRNKAYRST